ncbi:MAG TPA: glycoside hydrolase family 9 protein, partial [Rhizobiaceae bacterium]|nr:glycoside hydrolase family 9 protein [Rhizobiaceae bacterium]
MPRPTSRTFLSAAILYAGMGHSAIAEERYTPDTGSSMRVNQVGYLPDGPKRATLVNDSGTPLPWRLLDAVGEELLSGKTEPRGTDPSAGLNVHVIDFSALDETGEDLVLEVEGQRSHPFDIAPRLYAPLARDAMGYFYPVRSGIEINGTIAGEVYARPASHISSPSDEDVNKGDRDVPCQPAEISRPIYGEPWTCDYTLDVTGGWYDAGDHGKY